jgi:hypothetical protein
MCHFCNLSGREIIKKIVLQAESRVMSDYDKTYILHDGICFYKIASYSHPKTSFSPNFLNKTTVVAQKSHIQLPFITLLYCAQFKSVR